MSQPANPDTPLEAPAPQDKAWIHLLHLVFWVQLMQSSLIHHTIKLSTFHQTTGLISQSLQALLKCLLSTSTPPLVMKPTPTASVSISIAPVTLQLWIPHPTLPDAYNGAHSSRKHFLQSCLTYIYLSRDAFDFNVLKIAWLLSYMKVRCASTHALQVFYCPGGVESFLNWAAFEKDFQAEFFPLDPTKTAALMLHDQEQYRQGKQTLDKYINSF
ncbi:hypothetical protein C0989_011635 [Termitomyces sp. Mn162]|nr:hypothetical protein C0989_011635 [Termitomyces sp. Mn162]